MTVAEAFLVASAWLVAVTITFCVAVIVAGAVYTPVLLIVPDPLEGLMVQVTAVLFVFETVAVNDCVPLPYKVVVEGLTVIETGVSVMLAVALLEVSAWLTAVTVTICGLVITVGAVYKPELLIVPAPVVGLIVQVTAVFVVWLTVAENCCVLLP